jgi:putative ABC transport system substrate-binding protein
MNRRTWFATIGSGIAWARTALGQQMGPAGRQRRIGLALARGRGDPEGEAYLAAFRQRLEELGWMEGRNLEIDLRWLPSDANETLANVRELIARNPDLIIANGTPYLRAAQQVAGSIPIVFVIIADPVGQGFVTSLARPAGAITGFGAEEVSMGEKWLELLKEIAPDTTNCTCIFNPTTAASPQAFIDRIAAAGLGAGIAVTAAPVRDDADIDPAVGAAGRAGHHGIIVPPDVFLYARRQTIVAAAARHAVPAVYYDALFARAGGLLALGIDRVDQFRRAAVYVNQILNGVAAGELPVQMPVRFTLSINLRAARGLGLRVPDALLARADDVIE